MNVLSTFGVSVCVCVCVCVGGGGGGGGGDIPGMGAWGDTWKILNLEVKGGSLLSQDNPGQRETHV